MELTGQMKSTRALLDEAFKLHAKSYQLDNEDNLDGGSCHEIEEITEKVKEL